MRISKSVLAIAIGVVSVCALGASGETAGSSESSGDSTETSPVKHEPEDDVTVSKCYSDLGSPQADITILNHSSKASNYMVSVKFESADGSQLIDTSFVAVNDLNPGQSAVEQAVSFSDVSGRFTCSVSDVTRYASGG